MAGAGAGIGGNGGDGGSSVLQFSSNDNLGTIEHPFPHDDMPNSGENGEDCGIVTISGVNVIAIGGASGFGNAPEYFNASDSGGAGYPAARYWSVVELVGGRWFRTMWWTVDLLEDLHNLVAGLNQVLVVSGISGGWSDQDSSGNRNKIERTDSWSDGCVGGSGYYQFLTDCNMTNWPSWGFNIGGSSAATINGYILSRKLNSNVANCFGGNGGAGGRGGTITIDNLNNVMALNGKFCQGIDDNRETSLSNQCVIYAQLGFSLDDINSDLTTYHTDLANFQNYKNGNLEVAKVSDTTSYANDANGMINYLTSVSSSYRTIEYDVYLTYGKMGIGSGAGLHEYSNGSLNK